MQFPHVREQPSVVFRGLLYVLMTQLRGSIIFHIRAVEAQLMFPYAFACLCRALGVDVCNFIAFLSLPSGARNTEVSHLTCTLLNLSCMAEGPREENTTVHLSGKKEICDKSSWKGPIHTLHSDHFRRTMRNNNMAYVLYT